MIILYADFVELSVVTGDDLKWNIHHALSPSSEEYKVPTEFFHLVRYPFAHKCS